MNDYEGKSASINGDHSTRERTITFNKKDAAIFFNSEYFEHICDCINLDGSNLKRRVKEIREEDKSTRQKEYASKSLNKAYRKRKGAWEWSR